MTEPFIGEIQLFGFNYAPSYWAFCNGATLAVQQNTALYALIGAQYGGNGSTTFQLPNLVNRAACNQGQGPGLTQRRIGSAFGAAGVTLANNTMPAHTHPFAVYNQNDGSKRTNSPNPGNFLGSPTLSSLFAQNAQPNAQFTPNMCGPAGNNEPHENRQPYLALNFCIALQGAFPSFG